MEGFKVKVCLILFIISSIFACHSVIDKENLFGEWQYTKIEYTNKSIQNPLPDIKEQKPYFSFHQDGKAEIYSSKKIISKGSFILEGKIIQYEEVLDGGVKRKIPFLVKELNGNQLVFETMQAPIQRITAIKLK